MDVDNCNARISSRKAFIESDRLGFRHLGMEGFVVGILAWIVFGLIAGAIAQVIMPGNDPGSRSFGGWIITMFIGIVGAVLGGVIGSALGYGGVSGFNSWQLPDRRPGRASSSCSVGGSS